MAEARWGVARTAALVSWIASLAALIGCGPKAPDPPPGDAEALGALVGSAEIAWYDTADKKPTGAVLAGVRDGRLVSLRVAVPVADPAALGRLDALTRLTLDGAGWTGPLACGSLTSLTVRANPGFEPVWLAGCSNLSSLELLDSGLTGVDGFPGLAKLKTLHLGRNPIASLAGLPTLPMLERITLHGAEPGAEDTVPPQPALRKVITPESSAAAAASTPAPSSTPSPFGRNEVLGIDIPPPKNPWIPKITAKKGSTAGLDKACTVNHLGKFEIDCTFSIESLSGMVPLRVEIGSTHHEPGVIANVSTTAGKVRVYMPYYTVQQYVEATPGNPVEVQGILEKSWTSTGKLGAYHIVVEAQGGPAEGVVVKLKNAI